MQSKSQLRKHYRALRNRLSNDEQARAAKSLATRFIQAGLFRDIHHIALYLANDGEIVTQDLIHACWDAGKQVYLPVIHPFCAGHLLFLEYRKTTPMCANKYGIQEPKLNVEGVIPVQQLDAIMMPLVAFDEMANRLGMGGGYYDRTLSRVSHSATKLIGIAHDCQRADNLPIESWDVPLNAIMTPTQTY